MESAGRLGLIFPIYSGVELIISSMTVDDTAEFLQNGCNPINKSFSLYLITSANEPCCCSDPAVAVTVTT